MPSSWDTGCATARCARCRPTRGPRSIVPAAARSAQLYVRVVALTEFPTEPDSSYSVEVLPVEDARPNAQHPAVRSRRISHSRGLRCLFHSLGWRLPAKAAPIAEFSADP